MVIRNHLSSDISTNLMVADIAEELTKTIRRIKIDKTDKTKILGNLLEINKIVEESKSRQKFQKFKSQLEEIHNILNEPVHKSWMDKILSKTDDLICFMRNPETQSFQPKKECHLEKLRLGPKKNDRSVHQDDFIRQCFRDWIQTNAHSSIHEKSLLPISPRLPNTSPLIHPKESGAENNWDSNITIGSESEVLIVNYSEEKSLERSCEDMDTQKKTKRTDIANEGNDRTNKSMNRDELNILQGIINKRKMASADAHVRKEGENGNQKGDMKKIVKTPGTDIKKSKQISLKNLAHPNLKAQAYINLALFNKISKEKNNTLKSSRPIKPNETRIANVVETAEDLRGLKTELRQCLLKKLGETKIGEKANENKENRQKQTQIELKDEGKSSQEQQRSETDRDYRIDEKNKEQNGKGRTDIFEKSEKDQIKRNTKKDRKCNLSGRPGKNKENTETPPIATKVNNTEEGCQSITTRARVVKPETQNSDESAANRIEAVTETLADDLQYNTEEVFKHIGMVSYKKLISGAEYTNSKAEEILSSTGEEKPSSGDKQQTSSGDKTKSRRRHTRRRSQRKVLLDPDDYEELKTRCQFIRRELESIETKAGIKNKTRKEEEVMHEGLTFGKPAEAQKSHVAYLCTIM